MNTHGGEEGCVKTKERKCLIDKNQGRGTIYDLR